jgi:peptidyl-prolyl cis-trans isomerase C
MFGLAAQLSIGGTLFAQPAGPAPSDEVAARVNGTPITIVDLNRIFLAQAQAPYATVQQDPRAQEVRRQLLDMFIDRTLLLQEAHTLKLRVPPQALEAELQGLMQRFPSRDAFEEALKAEGLTLEGMRQDLGDQLLRKQLVQQEIVDTISVNPDDLKGFYDQHQSQYSQQEQVRARHILIKVPPETSAADEAKMKEKATKALARAKKGESFGKLAQELSDDTSQANGGDLGLFKRGQMVAPFEEAAFALKVGQVSELVRTPFGYHIIKLEERHPEKPLSYDEAKEQVKKDLTQERGLARYQEYIAGLRGKAVIDISLP